MTFTQKRLRQYPASRQYSQGTLTSSLRGIQRVMELQCHTGISLENIKNMKLNKEHLVVQKMGNEQFYEEYHVRVES